MSNNNNRQYEYMDEVSINSELICCICNKPFVEPISTPCDHTFCRDCIKRWIEKNKKSCPTCRQQIKTIDQFTQVSRPLRNILDRLQIKCLICGQTGLQRDNFNDHINKVCLKANASCSAADIKCPWTGLREELEKHLTTCKFEPLRPLLIQLITENRQLITEKQQLITEKQQLITEKQQLTDQVKQHNIQINELAQKLSAINNVHPILEKMIEDVSNSTIDLSQQKLIDRDLINIIPQIINKQCSILQLQGNAITSQGIIILADVLSKNSTTLQDLWLSNNCISDLGVQTLTRIFLSKNSTLKQLHLGSNCISDYGVNYLTEMLKTNDTLTDLWLYNNQITDQGVQNLANALKQGNRNLKHLDLQWNKLVTDLCVHSLINMLERNRILERLNLRKCSLSIAGKMQLLQAVVERKDFKLII